jgi:hypothetical protein
MHWLSYSFLSSTLLYTLFVSILSETFKTVPKDDHHPARSPGRVVALFMHGAEAPEAHQYSFNHDGSQNCAYNFHDAFGASVPISYAQSTSEPIRDLQALEGARTTVRGPVPWDIAYRMGISGAHFGM